MKSETRIKIRESRQKYFQEIQNLNTEKNIARQGLPEQEKKTVFHNDVTSKTGVSGLAKGISGSWADADRVIKQIKESIPVVEVSDYISGENIRHVIETVHKPVRKITRSVSATNAKVSEAVSKRTDKAIDRFNSFMMVIFDA